MVVYVVGRGLSTQVQRLTGTAMAGPPGRGYNRRTFSMKGRSHEAIRWSLLDGGHRARNPCPRRSDPAGRSAPLRLLPADRDRVRTLLQPGSPDLRPLRRLQEDPRLSLIGGLAMRSFSRSLFAIGLTAVAIVGGVTAHTD